MTTSSDHVAKLIANPKYQALVKKRNGINNTFFIIMLVIYAGFLPRIWEKSNKKPVKILENTKTFTGFLLSAGSLE